MDGLRDILSTNKRKSRKKKSPATDVDVDPNIVDTSMEAVLKDVLHKFQIQNALWSSDAQGRLHQVNINLNLNIHQAQV